MDRKANQEVAFIYFNFIKIITSIRYACKLSQYAAADIIQIDRSLLAKYENGETGLTLIRFIYIYRVYNGYITEHNIVLNEQTEKLKEKCHLLIEGDL